MSNSEMDVPVDASAATDRDSWLHLIESIGSEEGSFETLGPGHWAIFVEDGRDLVVTFESIATARARQGQMPLVHHIAAAKGWSHLCLICDGPTWFRDPAVYAYFDRLVDEAFFEDFDSVTFYGAGPMAYAACAFAVAAPGCNVLALNPVATLDPALTGWDHRFKAARRLDFTSRYGYAPDMTEGCARLTVICDPRSNADLMHAALFHAPQTLLVAARHAGEMIEPMLARIGILDETIIEAAESRLTTASFATLWRKRLGDAIFLKHLLQAVEATGNRRRVIQLCAYVTARHRISRFHKRLADLRGEPASDQIKA